MEILILIWCAHESSNCKYLGIHFKQRFGFEKISQFHRFEI